ncbi:uncharacterized protein [Prorops nasuta]|uniref:uncharacterized protein n=1 Tax=Prorops nasuta TaxID=863751 RepID=UPI0034CD9E8C
MDDTEVNSEHISDETVNNDLKAFREKLLNFLAQLFNYDQIPRNKIKKIIVSFFSIFKLALTVIEEKIENCVRTDTTVEDKLYAINVLFTNFVKDFEELNTERQRLNAFKNSNSFIAPDQITVGEREEFREEKGFIVYKYIPVSIEFIPLRKSLELFFELPYVFEETMDYIKQLQQPTNLISNYIQASSWKEKNVNFEKKIVFPLFLYYDDYETNNPLGSHRGIAKVGAVYDSVPCLPPHLQSKLDNIFLVMLFNTIDRQVLGNHCIFSKLIAEINYLETEGITVRVKGEIKKMYISLELLTGDNLGLHSMLGFNESFRSHYSCRFCLIHKSNLDKVFHENQCILRNVENYNKNVTNIDPASSGIKDPCVFHNVNGFHLLKNSNVDIIHDLLEEVCQYDLGYVLNHFIYVYENIDLSLHKLNNFLQGFSYDVNYTNRPVEILERHLRKHCIIISAAEMHC